MKPRTLIIVAAVLGLLVAGTFVRGPLPPVQLPAETIVGGLPFGFRITNTILAAWLTMAVLLILMYKATHFRFERMSLVPSGVQNVVEGIVEPLLNLVEGVAGAHWGRRFFPLVMTIFLFIMTSAWLALVPGFGTIGLVEKPHAGSGHHFSAVDLGPLRLAFYLDPVALGGAKEKSKEEPAAVKEEHPEPKTAGSVEGELVPFLRSANTDLNTPLALALVAVFFIELWGLRAHGFSYVKRFVNVGSLLRGKPMGLIDLYIGLVETIAEVARLISFTFRLFGNMLAGEILLAVITFLVPFGLGVAFYGLELLVGFVQALVFGMLTLVFASMAVAGHGEEPAEAGHHKPM